MTNNKVSIIGAGYVGSTIAYSLICTQMAEEIALIDINKDLVKSQVMDLQHSVPFWGYNNVKIGAYNDVKNSEVVVIACGASQKPGETRLDLLKKNSEIIKEVMPKIFKQNPGAVVIMVTNPVDILTNIAIKMFPRQKNQIFGSGTILDTARFRFLLGERLSVDPKSTHAYIVGEHGDSEVPLWSTAMIGNTYLDRYEKLTKTEKDNIFHNAKNAAYAIIASKEATYYAIAAGVVHLVEAVLYNKQTVFTVSHTVDGKFGIKDVCLSLPMVIGENGVVKKIDIEISKEEKSLLKLSAKKLKQAEKKIS